MATLKFNKVSYTVDHAVKGADYVHGYRADGTCVVSIDGIKDFSLVNYNGTYLNPDECIAEGCNDLRYCDGAIKAADGRSIPHTAVGAAPGSYGLGTASWTLGNNTRFDDASKLDDLRVNGFWAYQKSGAPLVSNYSQTQFVNGYTIASGSGFVTQRAVTLYTGVWIERQLVTSSGVAEWTPWAFVNPPMELGVEYLTTEKHLGKPVFVQVVDLGVIALGTSLVDWTSENPHIVPFRWSAWFLGQTLPKFNVNTGEVACTVQLSSYRAEVICNAQWIADLGASVRMHVFYIKS